MGCAKTDAADASCNTVKTNPDTVIVQHQMKGWELYSRSGCNDWYYTVATGTNSLKTYDEVTGKTISSAYLIQVFGKENLKAVLHKFPAGENIFWAGEGWLQKTWGSNYGNLQLPPADIVNELRQYSTAAGLSFNVGY